MSNLSYCTRCARLLCHGAHYELGGERRCYHCAEVGTLRDVRLRGMVHDVADAASVGYRLLKNVYAIAGRKGLFVRDPLDNRFLRPLPADKTCRVQLFRPAPTPTTRPRQRPGPAKQLLANGELKRRAR